jgi:hypothetical protein
LIKAGSASCWCCPSFNLPAVAGRRDQQSSGEDVAGPGGAVITAMSGPASDELSGCGAGAIGGLGADT